jgi:hypothetical protein
MILRFPMERTRRSALWASLDDLPDIVRTPEYSLAFRRLVGLAAEGAELQLGRAVAESHGDGEGKR